MEPIKRLLVEARQDSVCWARKRAPYSDLVQSVEAPEERALEPLVLKVEDQ
jgi:hypothetical protein